MLFFFDSGTKIKYSFVDHQVVLSWILTNMASKRNTFVDNGLFEMSGTLNKIEMSIFQYLWLMFLLCKTKLTCLLNLVPPSTSVRSLTC